MRSFAIEEPGSPVPALYATLVVLALLFLDNSRLCRSILINLFCTAPKNWFVQMWRDMGWEASWLCYDQVATSQIGKEKKWRFSYFTFFVHVCLSNWTLSFSKASRQWDAEFKSRIRSCGQRPRSGRHQELMLLAHLSLPWSIGWVALSFLFCSSFVPLW